MSCRPESASEFCIRCVIIRLQTLLYTGRPQRAGADFSHCCFFQEQEKIKLNKSIPQVSVGSEIDMKTP